MILLSHPNANDTVRHAARALNRAGVLGEFWTCANDSHEPFSLPVSPASVFELDCNADGGCATLIAPPARTRSCSGLQLGTTRRNLEAACRSLDRRVSGRLTAETFKGIYAFEGSADDSFRAAGERGLLRVYDLPRGHWRAESAICEEEAALEPDWAPTLELPRMQARATPRKDSELEQADLVIVASTFLLRTLDCVPELPATVAVLMPATPELAETTSPAAGLRGSAGKLRALFVGDLEQRNGLSYLFRACRELRRAVNLTVIGSPPDVPCPALVRELEHVRWLSACTPDEIRAEMAAHDVLVSPSLFDGFDPHLLSAMAAGLPVIATSHTAAPDILEHGVEGFIVPVRSTEEIVAKLDLLHREPDRRAEMSNQARQRAQRHNWETYERALAASVTTALRRW